MQTIPSIIHLICLPPYTLDDAKYNIAHLSITHPNFDIKVHTKIPDDFIFSGLPVFGPAQLSTLLRLDALRRSGGWYFDLDVHVHCDLKKLERMLNIGKNLTVSQLDDNGSKVCTFASCCPEHWRGWDTVISHMIANPKSEPGHYCTGTMGKLLRDKPYLCDYLPSNFVYSNTWLNHKGIGH